MSCWWSFARWSSQLRMMIDDDWLLLQLLLPSETNTKQQTKAPVPMSWATTMCYTHNTDTKLILCTHTHHTEHTHTPHTHARHTHTHKYTRQYLMFVLNFCFFFSPKQKTSKSKWLKIFNLFLIKQIARKKCVKWKRTTTTTNAIRLKNRFQGAN